MLNTFTLNFVTTEHLALREIAYTFATDGSPVVAFSIAVVVEIQYCVI